MDTVRIEKRRADQKGRSDTFRIEYFNKLAAGAKSPEEKARYAKLAERSKAIHSETRALSNDVRRTEATVVSKISQMNEATNSAMRKNYTKALKEFFVQRNDPVIAPIERAVKIVTKKVLYKLAA